VYADQRNLMPTSSRRIRSSVKYDFSKANNNLAIVIGMLVCQLVFYNHRHTLEGEIIPIGLTDKFNSISAAYIMLDESNC